MVMRLNGTKAHFISGLPRSGSTLLSAILNQNPRFSAGISSPVASLFAAVLPKMSGAHEYAPFFTNARRHGVLESLFQAYHSEALEQGRLIFDTNRTWTAKLALLSELFPQSKVICCVRQVPWVIDSVEKLVRRNPTSISGMFQTSSSLNVYGRVKDLMDSERGLVGAAWSSLREAWFGEHAKMLIVVRYESLTKNPKEVLSRIYEHLSEKPFEHDFENIEYQEDEFDRRLGMPGLHTVKRRVEYVERPTILPPDLFTKYVETNFWENEKINTKKVLIL